MTNHSSEWLDEILDHIECKTCGNPFCDHVIYAKLEAKQAIQAELSKAEKCGELRLLKKDIKYNTLLARYKRVYLGGDEDALPIKRHVKQLKKRLAKMGGEL